MRAKITSVEFDDIWLCWTTLVYAKRTVVPPFSFSLIEIRKRWHSRRPETEIWRIHYSVLSVGVHDSTALFHTCCCYCCKDWRSDWASWFFFFVSDLFYTSARWRLLLQHYSIKTRKTSLECQPRWVMWLVLDEGKWRE